MIFLKIYIIALTLLMIVHTAFTYAVARAFRVRVLEIGFCLGPTLVKRKVGTITFRINSIPLGSYLKLLENAESLKLESDSDGGSDSETEVEFELGNDRFYDDLNPLVRGAISAAGYFGVAATAILLCGFQNAWNSGAATYYQVWDLLNDPRGAGALHLKRLSQTAESVSTSLASAKVLSKLAAWQLVPLALSGSWGFVAALIGKKDYQNKGWFQLYFLVSIGLILYILIALCRAAYFSTRLQ